jgi:AraC family transcriptional regulator, transcriptional activator of pobA
MKRNPVIENYKFKPGFPHEIELVSLKSTFEQIKGMVTKPHRTDFYHVLWFQKGKATHLVDFKPIPVKPDSMLFIGKGRVLMFDKLGDYDGMALRFTDGFFCRNPEDSRFLLGTSLFNAMNESPNLPLKQNKHRFEILFGQIEEEISNQGDKHQHAYLRNIVHNLLISSDRLLAPMAGLEIQTGNDEEYGHRFKVLIDQDFKKSKRVAQYAEKMFITEKRLLKAITRLYGKPPKELIDERILLEAKRLLLFSDSTVKEISVDLGFDEPTNFTKYFRKHLSQTPARFRERYLG